jgi:primase-polymerase (primpol)-like protein
MDERRCGYCGGTMVTVRSDAKFCTTKCRVYASRKPGLPSEMTGKSRWMRWKPVRRGDRVTKMPITTSGAQASSTNASTWSTFADAKSSKAGVGLGFALGEGIGCIDLDHCITDGIVADWAQQILDRAPSTYIEVSQSGEGLHIFGLLPEGAGRNIRRGDVAIEFYSAGRFMAVTGNRFANAPVVLADLTEVVTSVS